MSGQTVSQDWFNICVMKKGISVSDWKEEHEREVIDIDMVSISSCVPNLSPSSSLSLIQKTKTTIKTKAEKELASQLSNHKKRPQQVAVSSIPLVGKADARMKVLKHEELKFLVPVKLSWLYEGNKEEVSINALVDTGVEATIFDTNFV